MAPCLRRPVPGRRRGCLGSRITYRPVATVCGHPDATFVNLADGHYRPAPGTASTGSGTDQNSSSETEPCDRYYTEGGSREHDSETNRRALMENRVQYQGVERQHHRLQVRCPVWTHGQLPRPPCRGARTAHEGTGGSSVGAWRIDRMAAFQPNSERHELLLAKQRRTSKPAQ